MIQRMIGAALFNADTYEEIEADPSAIGQAVLVVLLVTLSPIHRKDERVNVLTGWESAPGFGDNGF